MRVKIVKERMLQKEKEVHGKWYTKEKLEKSGLYSKHLNGIDDRHNLIWKVGLHFILTVYETDLVHQIYYISSICPQPRQSVQSIIEFCSRFPQALTRTVGWMWWVFSPLLLRDTLVVNSITFLFTKHIQVTTWWMAIMD